MRENFFLKKRKITLLYSRKRRRRSNTRVGQYRMVSRGCVIYNRRNTTCLLGTSSTPSRRPSSGQTVDSFRFPPESRISCFRGRLVSDVYFYVLLIFFFDGCFLQTRLVSHTHTLVRTYVRKSDERGVPSLFSAHSGHAKPSCATTPPTPLQHRKRVGRPRNDKRRLGKTARGKTPRARTDRYCRGRPTRGPG